MVLTTCIAHDIRRRMGLSLVQYAVADCIAQYDRCGYACTRAVLARDLGLSEQGVSLAISELEKLDLVYEELEQKRPTKTWLKSQLGEPVEVSHPDKELSAQVIQYLNERRGSRYRVDTNSHLLESILKQNPRLTFAHFRMTIDYLIEKWGSDEKMQEYIRPATIFRSYKQFMRYEEDARERLTRANQAVV